MSERFLSPDLGVVAVAIGTALFVATFAGNAAAQTTNPTSCDQLFHLPTGTIQYSVDQSLMNSTVCAAYQYLISKYTPGPCSKLGLSNPQVDGITKLTPSFAVNLAAMLKAAPMNIGIISAFRTQQAQQCANPKVTNSNHSKGCAVDLSYSQNDCSSQACQWVKANAATYHLQLRLQYSPEWNHLEPTACDGQSLGSVIASNVSAGNVGDEGGQPNPSNPLTQNPLLTTQPVSYANSNPFSSSPISATQPTQSCTPQYSCSNNTVYYQSNTCSTSVFQTCQYGCSGTTCNPTPSQSGSTSAQSLATQLVSAISIATSAPLTLTTGLSQQGSGLQNGSVITTIATGSGTQYSPEIGQSTFVANYSGSTYQPSSPFYQILQSIKGVLTSMLAYLRTL